ncbi:MAG: rhodanese-like domain-containing protein [Opitutales bacterium]
MKTLSVSEAQNLSSEDYTWIDVRSPGEYRGEHLAHAENIPLDAIEKGGAEHLSGKPLVLICQSGVRSKKAAELLAQKSDQEVISVEGGLNSWTSAGYPTEKGQGGSISIERQVRIGAGALVAIFSILGLTVHAGFFAVPIFVGCGLVFAGVTDICGMGLMLAKMPWNR